MLWPVKKMRVYKKTTDRVQADRDLISRATEMVKGGMKIKQVSEVLQIPGRSIYRYVHKSSQDEGQTN